MTRYGFLLDQDTCIGCHACTVACKAEHDIPLGVNRTWVKYVETGSFPDTQRHFAVLRCNHCDDAPCITICPTNSLFRRPDGIVDFDREACIGCKSCMNACPYDALYINPATQVAEKCNFCAHRVEVGLEPSCVIVCPTHSIIAGDLDDPGSEIARRITATDIVIRAPEQATLPKVVYKGAHPTTLDPLATAIPPDGMIWADTPAGHPTLPVAVPVAEAPGRTVYTTEHPAPWKGLVSAYLVTKAVAAGALLIGALLVVLGHGAEQVAAGVLPGALALAGAAATGILLVADLRQPRRFLLIFIRPNWSSWLVRGAWILLGHGALATAWFAAGVFGWSLALGVLALPAVAAGVAAAGYTAFLFGQCEGRDAWQSRLLLPLLVAQAVVAGAGSWLVAGAFADLPGARAVRLALLSGVVAVALLTVAELSARHAGAIRGVRAAHVRLAHAALTRGRYAFRFWVGGIATGLGLPVLLLLVAETAGAARPLAALAGATALTGLAAYEDAFVRAGQSVPLS